MNPRVPAKGAPTTRQITRCQHCGTAFPTKRPDLRKWCDRCRELKTVVRLGQYPKRCIVCGQEYYPNRFRQSMCASCSGSPVGRSCDTERCMFCDRPDRLLPGVALCYICAGGTEHHTRVMRSATKALEKVKK